MIQSAVENACFEGARRGIVPGATNAACVARTEQFLELAGVNEYVVTVEPAVIDTITNEIVVTTEVKLSASNGFGISGFFKNKGMTKSVSLPSQ